MLYIGKLDKEKLGIYKYKIITEDVVLTEERMYHIYEHHYEDYKKIIKNISKAISEPKEILEDCKNKDTIFFITKLEHGNLNVIVRLNTTNSKEHPENSIMTAWIIRDSNLKKMYKKIKLFTKRNKYSII